MTQNRYANNLTKALLRVPLAKSYLVGFEKCRIAGTHRIIQEAFTSSAVDSEWLAVTFGDASAALTEDVDRLIYWSE